jgi:hypothetical protein
MRSPRGDGSAASLMAVVSRPSIREEARVGDDDQRLIAAEALQNVIRWHRSRLPLPFKWPSGNGRIGSCARASSVDPRCATVREMKEGPSRSAIRC